MACIDVVAGGACVGVGDAAVVRRAWNVVNRRDATGATTGVCVFAARSGSCLSDADPSTRTPVANFVNVDTYFQGYSHSLEAEAGTRTLVGSLSRGGLGCYDWKTMAPCTGGGYDSEGWLQRDRNGGFLPSAYGAAFDGACAIGLGDPGQVFTVDPAGSSPCLSLRSGASRTRVDLREQRADRTVGRPRGARSGSPTSRRVRWNRSA